MAPNITYDDDDAINALLDNLIASGAPETDPTVVDAATAQQNLTYTSDTLHEGVKAVNSLLHNLSLATPLPALDASSQNAPTVLAAALTTLVRLARGANANRTLRAQAENAARATGLEVERLQTSLSAARERAETSAGVAASARREAADSRRAADAAARRATADANDARAKLAAAAHREKLLVMEARRRDKEYAQLQRRVHVVAEAAHGREFIQTVTVSRGNAVERVRAAMSSATDDVTQSFEEISLSAEGDSVDIIVSENERFRELLRAVQEELDDIIIIHNGNVRQKSEWRGEYPEDEGALTADGTIGGEEEGDLASSKTTEPVQNSVIGSEYIEGDANTFSESENGTNQAKAGSESESGLEGVSPAPTEEQMRLPFEVIREDFEESLEKKFRMVREALANSSE